MSDLRDRLARLGLSQYHQIFAAEGFESWETVVDITESDLSHLNVKLGHRRKLQRAIAESRGQSSDRPLPLTLGRQPSADRSYRSDDSGPESKSRQNEAPTVGPSGTSTKRKYRRHPKPDEHAPERPPSAYVIFSNQVRESLKGQDLSFTEIAKVVGERWQVLPAEEREGCERQANGAKEKYYSGLAEYKKTPQYEAYQKYLEDFKAKHAVPTKEGKRSKLETETSRSTRSSSRDQHDRLTNRRPSSGQPELPSMGTQRPNASPPFGPVRLPAGPQSSKPTSPAAHSLSSFNSPRMREHFSPILASPRSAILSRDTFLETSLVNSGRDLQGSLDASYLYQAPAYGADPHHAAAIATPPGYPYAAHYQSSGDPLLSRRSVREHTRLPPLSHEDTTLSSESGHSGRSIPLAQLPGQPLPLDPTKSFRMLPQPVPSLGPAPSPLDRLERPQPSPVPTSQLQYPSHDYRTQGALAVLLRAGELAARAADDENMEEASP